MIQLKLWWGSQHSNILLSTFPCAAFVFLVMLLRVREIFRRVLKVTVYCPLHKTESVLDKTSCSCLLDMVWNQSWHIAIWFNLLMQLLFHPWEWPEVAIKDNYSVYFLPLWDCELCFKIGLLQERLCSPVLRLLLVYIEAVFKFIRCCEFSS